MGFLIIFRYVHYLYSSHLFLNPRVGKVASRAPGAFDSDRREGVEIVTVMKGCVFIDYYSRTIIIINILAPPLYFNQSF